MIWAMMQHLGYNMWHDEAIWRGPGRMKWSNFCRDTMMCQDVSWKLRMKRLLEPGSGTKLDHFMRPGPRQIASSCHML